MTNRSEELKELDTWVLVSDANDHERQERINRIEIFLDDIRAVALDENTPIKKLENIDNALEGILGFSEEDARRDYLERSKTAKGGYTRRFIESISLKWPPEKGWKQKYIRGEI